MKDSLTHDYKIILQLGHNYTGGRVTYLATNTQTEEQVVIKEFQFAQSASWSGYDVYQQEIELLKRLNHPNIPKYLDSFPTEDGFCMVQEYMEAEPLSKPGNWSPGEIKQIALSILEILEYLQSFSPIIIHRDIKPENILIRRLDPPQPPPPLGPPHWGKRKGGEDKKGEEFRAMCLFNRFWFR